MKTLISTVLIAVLLTAAALMGLVYSGAINVAAVEEDSGFTQWLLHTTYEHSVASHAAGIEVPGNLDSESMINRGAQNYQAMCTGCHTAPGEQPTVQSQGLNPHPPDLAELSAELTPGEAFWVIKNGIRMTGMPAFGPTHEDQELWPLVAFLERMHNATASEFEQAVGRAARQAPANDGHDHRHGNETATGHGGAGHADSHHAHDSDAAEQSHAHAGHDHNAHDEQQPEQSEHNHDEHDHEH